MIRSYFGLTDNPFALRDIKLLEHQQEIHDTLNVHCQQGGLCLVVGTPGTGKSVIKESLKRLPEKQYLVATVARTLHTYTNTVKILCEAFRIEFESSAFNCERRLIKEAFSLNHTSKMLVTVIDDAVLDDVQRKVAMSELMPAPQCGAMHAMLAVAAQRAQRRPLGDWLHRRAELLCTQEQLAGLGGGVWSDADGIPASATLANSGPGTGEISGI